MAATGVVLAACSSGATAHVNTADGHARSGATFAVTSPAASAVGTPVGAATPAAPAAAASACALVTEQELTPLLGADPGPGQATSDSTTVSCAYTRGVAVTIVVDHSGGRSQFDLFCSTNQPQPNIHNVSGVADGACLTIVGGPIAAMYILKGSDLMSINIQAGLDTKITPEALSALGKIAAGRL
ncbi:MAG: hypothetical protein DLM57_05655 [Pseudonocardiales bacterium]|nr:MAG: hypothetical protein DLM57_05655 [Pseudonocardiales bacterium]